MAYKWIGRIGGLRHKGEFFGNGEFLPDGVDEKTIAVLLANKDIVKVDRPKEESASQVPTDLVSAEKALTAARKRVVACEDAIEKWEYESNAEKVADWRTKLSEAQETLAAAKAVVIDLDGEVDQ